MPVAVVKTAFALKKGELSDLAAWLGREHVGRHGTVELALRICQMAGRSAKEFSEEEVHTSNITTQ